MTLYLSLSSMIFKKLMCLPTVMYFYLLEFVQRGKVGKLIWNELLFHIQNRTDPFLKVHTVWSTLKTLQIRTKKINIHKELMLSKHVVLPSMHPMLKVRHMQKMQMAKIAFYNVTQHFNAKRNRFTTQIVLQTSETYL